MAGQTAGCPSLLSPPLALAAAHQVPGEDGGVLRVAQAVDGVDPAGREAVSREQVRVAQRGSSKAGVRMSWQLKAQATRTAKTCM